MKRLRVLHVVMKPVLVWDDGTEFAPGPEVEASAVTLSGAAEYIERLPVEVDELAERLPGGGS